MTAERGTELSHPLENCTREPFYCDYCDHRVNVYHYDGAPSLICECGNLMETATDLIEAIGNE